jgi:hypothetical protein
MNEYRLLGNTLSFAMLLYLKIGNFTAVENYPIIDGDILKTLRLQSDRDRSL